MNDGGPFFPSHLPLGEAGAALSTGISLVDWFAGQALSWIPYEPHPESLAQMAYIYAAAMLAERERRMKEEKP